MTLHMQLAYSQNVNFIGSQQCRDFDTTSQFWPNYL